MAKVTRPALAGWKRRGTLRAVFGALALVLVACHTRTSYPGEDPFAGDGAAAREIRIRVRNDNFYDATLTALGDAGRRRLGTVGGNQSAIFSMPWTFTGTLQIEVDLLAGPTCTTDPITVSPGEDVELEIMADFDSTPYCR